MFEQTRSRWSWFLVAGIVIAGIVLFRDIGPAVASDDHDVARALRAEGNVLPLAELLAQPGLRGQRVLEAELEREHGRLVYELELLDENGQVRKRYYDAQSGVPLDRGKDR